MQDRTGGEILSIQAGAFANTVGSHYWNNQIATFSYDPKAPKPDVSHDCLFRAGKTVHGQVTYLPRAIMIDLSGSSGPLIQNVSEQDNLKEKLSEAQLAHENTNETWLDSLRTPLHSSTLNIVKQFSHFDDPPRFDKFSVGQKAFGHSSIRDTFEDSVHLFLEECDIPQGIQCFLDIHDGFAGLGASLVEMLRDDHGHIPIFGFCLIPQYSSQHIGPAIINEAQALVSLFERSTLVVPTASVGWDGQDSPSLEHCTPTDALAAQKLAYVLDSVSLGYRLKNDGHRMGEVSSMLIGKSTGFRNFAAAGGSVPLFSASKESLNPRPHHLSTLLSALGEKKLHKTGDITFYCPAYSPHINKEAESVEAMYCVIRGVEKKELCQSPEEIARRNGSLNEFDRCTSAREMISRYLGKTRTADNFFVAEGRELLPISSAEPQKSSVAALGVLSSDRKLRESVVDLQSRYAASSRRSRQKFEDSGFSADDFEETNEALLRLIS